MYVKITKEKTADGKDREEILSQRRPANWVFDGFMAFVAFGPLALSAEMKSNLMSGSKLLPLY